MILSVGCGGNICYKDLTLRDINLDIRIPQDHIENFVCADANFLPFKNQCFEMLIAKHLVEHLENPTDFLKEAKRVANKVEVTVPHPLHWNAYWDRTHKYVYVFDRFVKIVPLIYWLAFLTIRFPFIRNLIGKIFGIEFSNTVLMY